LPYLLYFADFVFITKNLAE